MILMSMILGYVLIAVFIGIERRMRKTDAAKSWSGGIFDRRSTLLNGALFEFAIFAPPLLDYIQFGLVWYATAVGFTGLAIMLFGLLMRVWAARTLGEFYTRTLRVTENQQIVEKGPYKFVRHPGYLGVIMLYTGFGVASGNWIATMAIVVFALIAYTYRIKREEAMLIAAFGDRYRDYMTRTRKIIPHIYWAQLEPSLIWNFEKWISANTGRKERQRRS
jgi:protein-S-isoprenylcysteine O-methyltransferase Ste14